LGSVLHKIVELISKGVISDEALFDVHWTTEIAKKEAFLVAQGLSLITPLKYFADGFALKKIKARNLLKKRMKNQWVRSVNSKRYLSEEKLSNSEKTISGIADLIIEDLPFVSIIDFKTGKIYDENLLMDGILEVKKEYQYQLKLYCYLYYLNSNILPKRLSVVTLDNLSVDIEFSLECCQALYEEATAFIHLTNAKITLNEVDDLARCSTENCIYCSYRPACKFYSKWMEDHFEETKDLKGKLLNVSIFGNNTMGMELEVGGKVALINNFNSLSYDEMKKKQGTEIRIFNLKKSRHSWNALATNYTIIYA